MNNVKTLELAATPPGVVIVILPVMAPGGTVAVTWVRKAEVTENVAGTPPKVTFDVCVRPVPLMTTCVPTGPLSGSKPVSVGMTLKTLSLVSVPDEVVTVTDPVVPATGTNAVRNLSLTTSKLAEPVPNFTLVAPARDCPRSCTF